MDPLEDWIERHEALLGSKMAEVLRVPMQALQSSCEVALEVLYRPLKNRQRRKRGAKDDE